MYDSRNVDKSDVCEIETQDCTETVLTGEQESVVLNNTSADNRLKVLDGSTNISDTFQNRGLEKLAKREPVGFECGKNFCPQKHLGIGRTSSLTGNRFGEGCHFMQEGCNTLTPRSSHNDIITMIDSGEADIRSSDKNSDPASNEHDGKTKITSKWRQFANTQESESSEIDLNHFAQKNLLEEKKNFPVLETPQGLYCTQTPWRQEQRSNVEEKVGTWLTDQCEMEGNSNFSSQNLDENVDGYVPEKVNSAKNFNEIDVGWQQQHNSGNDNCLLEQHSSKDQHCATDTGDGKSKPQSPCCKINSQATSVEMSSMDSFEKLFADSDFEMEVIQGSNKGVAGLASTELTQVVPGDVFSVKINNGKRNVNAYQVDKSAIAIVSSSVNSQEKDTVVTDQEFIEAVVPEALTENTTSDNSEGVSDVHTEQKVIENTNKLRQGETENVVPSTNKLQHSKENNKADCKFAKGNYSTGIGNANTEENDADSSLEISFSLDEPNNTLTNCNSRKPIASAGEGADMPKTTLRRGWKPPVKTDLSVKNSNGANKPEQPNSRCIELLLKAKLASQNKRNIYDCENVVAPNVNVCTEDLDKVNCTTTVRPYCTDRPSVPVTSCGSKAMGNIETHDADSLNTATASHSSRLGANKRYTPFELLQTVSLCLVDCFSSNYRRNCFRCS